MSKSAKITSVLLAIILCFMFIVSIADTNETQQKTNFNQDNMIKHIEKLSENGPRSIVDKEANKKAMDYIISQVEQWGVVNKDTTKVPAYLVQDYVAVDDKGKYQNFYLENVIVHIPANASDKSNESAIFFSYLNVTTVVYDHTTVIILAAVVLALILANILLSVFYRKQNNIGKTAKAILAVIACLALTAGVTYALYYLFQLVAALAGVIDIHMFGTITYSNIAIVIGIALTALAMSVVTAHFATKWLRIERRDLVRAYAYIHAFLGLVLSFVLKEASYLFVFSGILLMINELLVTLIKKVDFAAYHGELFATALYFPIVIPIIFLATSALGMTMAYVYGLVFAMAIFAVGVAITPMCEKFSIRSLVNALRKKNTSVSAVEGALHILIIAMVILLCTSIVKPNASVNLQGKQSIPTLPYDDALVYVCDTNGDYEYRVYDLNAYGALKEYAPDMKYAEEYYIGSGENKNITLKAISEATDNKITVNKNVEDSLVYLDFKNIKAESFTVDDGITKRTYKFEDKETYAIKLHSECTVTLNGGSADVEYKEVIRDYSALIPAEYAGSNEKLHFNLWLVDEFKLSA